MPNLLNLPGNYSQVLQTYWNHSIQDYLILWESYNMSKQNFVQGEKVVNGLISIELETFRHQSEMRLSSRKMLIIIIQNESNPKLEKSGRSKRSSSFFFSHGGSNAAQIALMAGAMLFGQLDISPNRNYKRKLDQTAFCGDFCQVHCY